MNETKLETKLSPIKPANFQTAEHRYSRFDCVVPEGTSKDDLENPDLWVNVAPRLKMFDEVRVICEDHSFVANLIVLFSQGTDARLKVISGADLDVVEDTELPQGKYDIKLKGSKKWCLFNTETGEDIKTHIATKSSAQKALEDHVTALRL